MEEEAARRKKINSYKDTARERERRRKKCMWNVYKNKMKLCDGSFNISADLLLLLLSSEREKQNEESNM